MIPKEKIIYVLVWVTYDYFRFQENKYADTDKKKVLQYIRKNPSPYEYDERKVPVYFYEADNPPEKLRDKEIRHYWIQEIKIME